MKLVMSFPRGFIKNVAEKLKNNDLTLAEVEKLAKNVLKVKGLEEITEIEVKEE